jgi:hypothetical protein
VATCVTCKTRLSAEGAACPVCDPWKTPAARDVVAQPGAADSVATGLAATGSIAPPVNGSSVNGSAFAPPPLFGMPAPLPIWLRGLDAKTPAGTPDLDAAFRNTFIRVLVSWVVECVIAVAYFSLAGAAASMSRSARLLIPAAACVLLVAANRLTPGYGQNWLGAAVAHAKARPDIGVRWLAGLTELRRSARLGCLGLLPLAVVVFGVFIRVDTASAVRAQFVAIGVMWLLMAGLGAASFFAGPVPAYRKVRARFAKPPVR